MNTPCPHLEVLRYPIVKTRNSSWRYRYTKKAWNPTVAVPRLEAFALPLVLKRQREAHAEYKITLVLFKVKVRVRAYTYTQKTYHNWHKRDNSISRRTSIVAQFRIPFESCEVSRRQNKALINAFLICLLPSADDVQTSPAQVHGAKVQIYFGLSKKNALLLAFFSLEDAASRYCLEVIG